MRQIILAIIGAGSVVLLASVTRNRGWYLADQICAQGAFLCDNPSWALIALAFLAFVLTVRTIVKT